MNTNCNCGSKQLTYNVGYLSTWPWGLLKANQLILACAAVICICCLPALSGSNDAASFVLSVLIIAVTVTIISVFVNSFYLPQTLPSVPFGFAELAYCIIFSVLCFVGSMISFISALHNNGSAAACFSFATIFMMGALAAYIANACLIFQHWQGTTWLSLIAVKADESAFEKPNNDNERPSPRSHGRLDLNCAGRLSRVQNCTSAGSSCSGIVIQVPPTVLPPPAAVTIVPPATHSVAFANNNNDGYIEEAENIGASNKRRDYSFGDAVQKFDEL